MDLHGRRVLAVGTRGAQGTGLIEALDTRGAVAVRVSTSAAQVTAWRDAGTAAVRADLADPASVAAVTEDVDAAVVHLPLGLGSPDGVAAFLRSVDVLRDAGLPVAVNVGSPVPGEDVPDPFGARRTVRVLLDLGAGVVAPTAYLENHAAPWALGRLADGELVYPRPPGDVLAWIAAGDVTAAAVAALEAEIVDGVLQLAGPQRLTFEELAQELGAGAGRPVAFRRVTPQAYADLLAPVVGAGAAAAVAAAYGAMPEEPNPTMSPDASATWRRLGLAPTTARRWAAEVLRPRLEARAA